MYIFIQLEIEGMQNEREAFIKENSANEPFPVRI
jgi:hypothetical protein